MGTLYENIKKARARANKTLEDVARAVGVSRQTIQKYESGIITNIPSDKIELLAKALNVSPADLMGWNEDISNNSEDKNNMYATKIEGVYLSFAKEAQDEGIDPTDIRNALDLIKNLRGEK